MLLSNWSVRAPNYYHDSGDAILDALGSAEDTYFQMRNDVEINHELLLI